MTDLLQLAAALEHGDIRCVACGCNPVVRDPFTDRLVLRHADIFEQDGRFVGVCEHCRGDLSPC